MRQCFSPTYRRNRSLTKEQERLKEILKLGKVCVKCRSKIQGLGYRVYYVWYAGSFLIDINGPRRIV